MSSINLTMVLLLFLNLTSIEAKSQVDVVSNFELQLENHFKSFKDNPRSRLVKLGGGWVREQFELNGEYKYDIQKTNSLISPYSAYCEFTLKRKFTEFHDSKEDAIIDLDYKKNDLKLHKHFYSYQKGKWVISKRENEGYFGWNSCNERILEGDNKGDNNIFGCWETNF